ncbi:MAG: zinc-dependent metalloprotease [Bdellovibrionaceae bacterium]|nr:zinc-dependent metalloprotease [Pseudobdellovibrionaceae bacterium]
MKQIPNTILKVIGAVAMASGLIACGAEREHKPLPKIEVFSKSSIDTEAEYLYVPSTDQVSRSTNQGRPYWQGDARIVKLRFEKNHLVAYAQEKDDRFSDNTTNNKPVFRIPIRHIDYREMRDPFGEGTNIEEENNYIDWSKRKYFEPKPEQFAFTDVNMLPSEFGKIFGYECSSMTGQSELNFDVKDSGIDIVIKRDYRTNYFCDTSVMDLFDLSWSEVTHYSLVPMKNLIAEDYDPIIYKRDWENTFGFFQTLDQKYDSANSPTQNEEVYYMNRWNPQRKEVVYHLDPKFEKPENKSIKEATLIGFERLNKGLEEAGVNFRLVVKEGPQDMLPGDLRYTSVVIVEDPLAVGLLGYGPSVANPRTGELVQARTVMYPGVMKQFIRMAYDEVLRLEAEREKQALAGNKLLAQDANIVNQLRDFAQGSVEVRQQTAWKPHRGDMSHLALAATSTVEPSSTDDGEEQGEPRLGTLDRNIFDKPPVVDNRGVLSQDFVKRGDWMLFDRTAHALRSMFQGFQNQNDPEKFDIDQLDIIDFYSRNNMTPAREQTFIDIADTVLRDEVLALGQKVPWDKLDESVRAQIVDLVMPYVWIPTFIHEVGHNLGLRHNFAGSEDRDNFYSLQELADRGITSDMGSPYASMMEYTKSEITSLRVPGKYDIAALRYGYNQQVELEDGSLVPVGKGQIPADLGTLKAYEYCSDEGVSLNPNCNRFDEGVGYAEIAKSLISSYEDMYKLRNFRNGRANFSMIDDIYYAARINGTFRSLRLMLERFSDILMDYDLDMQTVEEIEWLKEMNDGAKIASDFFVKILSEPDLNCLLTQNGQFSQMISYKEIKTLTGSFNAKDCFGITGLNTQFAIIGQVGRKFEDEKYRDNPNIYLDQIDVRGVWIDKLIALKYLVARNLNNFSFDKRSLSYLDHPEVGTEINNVIKNLLIGDVVTKTTVTFSDGSTLDDFEYGHTFSNGYEITKPLTNWVGRYLGIRHEKIDLIEAVGQVLAKEITQGETSLNNENFKESIRVYERMPEDGRPSDEFEVYRVGPRNYIISEDNEVGSQAFKRLGLMDLYDKFSREDLIQIYTLISRGIPLPATATEEQKAVYASGEANVYLYLVGEMPTRDYYYKLLRQSLNI